MRYTQKLIYLFEQFQTIESALVKEFYDRYEGCHDENNKISSVSPDFGRAMIYQQFYSYEGPILARYTILIQLYALFERFSIKLSKNISENEGLLQISDLNGRQNFTGIKTFYCKVKDVKFGFWSELDNLRQVRNLIAHCDGYVEYSDQETKIRRLVESDGEMIILKNERLAVSEEFVRRSFRAVVQFFDLVEPMVGERNTLMDFDLGLINDFRRFERGEK